MERLKHYNMTPEQFRELRSSIRPVRHFRGKHLVPHADGEGSYPVPADHAHHVCDGVEGDHPTLGHVTVFWSMHVTDQGRWAYCSKDPCGDGASP